MKLRQTFWLYLQHQTTHLVTSAWLVVTLFHHFIIVVVLVINIISIVNNTLLGCNMMSALTGKCKPIRQCTSIFIQNINADDRRSKSKTLGPQDLRDYCLPVSDSTSVQPVDVFWSHRVTVSACTAAGLLPSLVRRPGTLSRIISPIRTLLQTTSSAC